MINICPPFGDNYNNNNIDDNNENGSWTTLNWVVFQNEVVDLFESALFLNKSQDLFHTILNNDSNNDISSFDHLSVFHWYIFLWNIFNLYSCLKRVVVKHFELRRERMINVEYGSA